MRRKPASTATGSDDAEMLVRWAAEEFVEAGRVDSEATRLEHRRRAIFFTEVFRELSFGAGAELPQPEPSSDIGCVLARAFGQPRAAPADPLGLESAGLEPAGLRQPAGSPAAARKDPSEV